MSKSEARITSFHTDFTVGPTHLVRNARINPESAENSVEEIIALIRERGVCHSSELGITRPSDYTSQLAAQGFRTVSFVLSKKRNRIYGYSDIFTPAFHRGSYYFEEPFNENVAQYFANLMAEPINGVKANVLRRAFVNAKFTATEARAIVSVKHTYSSKYLRSFLRMERYKEELQLAREGSGRP